MPNMMVVALAVLLGLGLGADCARILAFLPFPAPSHMISFTALTRALAERGHHVDLLCAYPQDKNHPNQRVIAIGEHAFSSGLLNTTTLLHDDSDESNGWKKIMRLNIIGQLSFKTCSWVLEQPEVQKLLQQPAGSYDLILLEPFFAQESYIALGHKFNAPVVAFHSHGDIADVNYIMGSTTLPSYKPYPYIDVPDEMDIVERAVNTFFTLYHLYLKWYQVYPLQQQLADKFFPGSPPVVDLLSNISLAILNSHHTLCYPAPSPPNMVYAGGMHINHKTKPLPEGLKEFMDGAKEGVVYFSMGSLLKASDMTEEQKSMFMEAFRSLKQKVLVKWNADPPANLPSNVRLETWLPQGDVLAHPNTRLFITHGGLLGTQEAVYHGVPVIGIPRFGDQRFNIRLARRKGYGLEIPFRSLSRELIESGIREVLDSPRYAEAARRLSQLLRDQPLKPLDSAVFWVEHVLRHGGQHLRPASVRLRWYQYFLIDILLVALLPLLGLALLLTKCVRVCRGRRPTKSTKTD